MLALYALLFPIVLLVGSILLHGAPKKFVLSYISVLFLLALGIYTEYNSPERVKTRQEERQRINYIKTHCQKVAAGEIYQGSGKNRKLVTTNMYSCPNEPVMIILPD